MRHAETSALAYNELLGATLTGLQLKALRLLEKFGPCTARELCQAAGEPIPLQKRLSELVDIGMAVRLPHRKCAVTQKSACVWRATTNSPQTSKPAGASPPSPRTAPPVRSAGGSFTRGTRPDRPEGVNPRPQPVAAPSLERNAAPAGRQSRWETCRKCGGVWFGGAVHAPRWRNEKLVDCAGDEVRR